MVRHACLHPCTPAQADVNESTAARLATSGETFEHGKLGINRASAAVSGPVLSVVGS